MAYIIKNTSALINTRITDVGRRYLSQGNFNISYFQIGDSEVSYSAVTNYIQTNNNILMPAFNAHNNSGIPESNKQHIKYPYYLSGSDGVTYGIPFMDSQVQTVYNSAESRGFFSMGKECTSYSVTNNTANPLNYSYISCETNELVVASVSGNTSSATFCSNGRPTAPKLTINMFDDCGSSDETTIHSSDEYVITSNYWVDVSTLTGQTTIDIEYDSQCGSITGTPSVGDFLTMVMTGDCGTFGNSPFLTFKIQDMVPATGITGTTFTVTLDRAVPNYSAVTSGTYYARTYIYPSGMTVIYDTVTPEPYWETDVFNYETTCDVINRESTLIWNMNIPWSESPAGVFSNTYEDYTRYGSVSYIGTKEYLGYQTNSAQTDTDSVYYYNSFDEKKIVEPKDQKAIAIIHYTNQTIDNVYGEKFATIPFDFQNPTDDTGMARHFKLSIPHLMWHKSNDGEIGQDFYIDPPGYDLCTPYYIKSVVNEDMNDPGIRYYHLWDTNPDDNSNLNRIGKVFPDQQIIIIDDEEVIGALSYKSNRNWTLPAPKVSLVPPNLCDASLTNDVGVMTSDDQVMWVTYRFDCESGITNSLHCNYYTKIYGPDTGCTDTSQNVAIKFGNEFPFLNNDLLSFTGFNATSLKIIYQITADGERPISSAWKEYDVTSGITLDNGFIIPQNLTGVTFIIDQDVIAESTTYNLSNYIDIPLNGEDDVLNFGDEYYFYGNIETDISATIYEMRYLVNLVNNQFTNTSNPTWTPGTSSYVTEIGLYNSEKDLMVISKLQSPELRIGTQQYVIKLDF